jgi:DDE superfamily endonuclease
VPSIPDDPITFTCALEARRETVYFLAKLIREHCEHVGTRRGTRALGPFRHAVLVLRWFLDGTRVRQLATDSRISKSTCYARLHEAIDLLAALAPDVHEALLAAKAAGFTHLNLDGTLIHTDRVAMKGPNSADLWWSGKHKHHGGNIQVLSHPDGFPCWASDVRPGREHDTTCAKKARDLVPALEFYEAEYQMPTLTDLGYVSLSSAIRHPHKKPKGGELTEEQTTYNKVIRAVHAPSERANALLKETFTALQTVSLSPTRIGAIIKAALVLLHLEHGRPLPGNYTK